MKKTFLFAVLLAAAWGAGCSRAPKESPEPPAAAARPARYHCPMHPQYVSDKPGDCPICGMRLVPDEAARQGDLPGAAAPGLAAVDVPPGREQLIGVRTAPVEERPLSVTVRASARVAYDPELYAALEEYRESSRGGGSSDVAGAVGVRLRQMGLSEAQVGDFARKGKPATELLLGGKEGVWIYAQVYAQEAGLVKPGQRLLVTAAAFPGKVWEGRVAAVDRVVDAETRTLRVRAQVPDPGGLLKPGMYAEAAIQAVAGRALAVPREAVIDSGTRQIVFVESAPGRYSPREVRLGREADDQVEVLEGLAAGEKAVVSGNFLIDSESKLKAALAEAAGGAGR